MTTTLSLKYETRKVGDFTHIALTKDEFAKFNLSLLDLGSVSAEAQVVNAIAAIVDLEGFTDFCKQIDPHLVLPAFLSDFLAWLFGAVGKMFTWKTEKDEVVLWSGLPIFAKFLGDGVLFLWKTDGMNTTSIANVAMIMREVCGNYPTQFVAKHREHYSSIPPRMRVGIARGQVFSIGDGRDYVGPCINMAARLQKLASLSFAVSKKGFDPADFSDQLRPQLVVKRTRIRGISDDELVVISKTEFDALTPEEKALFE